MPGRSSLLGTKTGNPHYAAVAHVREHLAPTLQRGKGGSHGLAVDDRGLKEAKDQVAKVDDPILAEPLPSPSQVCNAEAVFITTLQRCCDYIHRRMKIVPRSANVLRTVLQTVLRTFRIRNSQSFRNRRHSANGIARPKSVNICIECRLCIILRVSILELLNDLALKRVH